MSIKRDYNEAQGHYDNNKGMIVCERTVRPKTTADAEKTGNTWPCVQSRELADTTPSACVIPGVHILYT
jgi:hypothetical protein